MEHDRTEHVREEIVTRVVSKTEVVELLGGWITFWGQWPLLRTSYPCSRYSAAASTGRSGEIKIFGNREKKKKMNKKKEKQWKNKNITNVWM